MAISFARSVRKARPAIGEMDFTGAGRSGPELQFLPFGDNGSTVTHAMQLGQIILDGRVVQSTSFVQVCSRRGLTAEVLVQQPGAPEISPALVVMQAMQRMYAEGRCPSYGPGYPDQATVFSTAEELFAARPELEAYKLSNATPIMRSEQDPQY